METQLRVTQHTVTTVLGTLTMLAAIVLFFWGRLSDKFEFGLGTLIPVLLLGWVLLMAKDSLLEGITMGVFKLKKPE